MADALERGHSAVAGRYTLVREVDAQLAGEAEVRRILAPATGTPNR